MAKNDTPTAASFLSQVIDRSIKRNGHAYLTSEHHDHTYGVLIPSLSFQWFIGGCNVLPLGRILGIAGDYGSFKSSLACEIGSWVIEEGGIDANIDVEQKTSATLYPAIRHKMSAQKRSHGSHHMANSMEDWQETVIDFLTMADDAGYRALPPGQRIPIRVGIDSIIAKGSEASQQAVMEEGHAEERGYATGNNAIKRFFESINLNGIPILLTYITHLKDEQSTGKPTYGATPKKELGGKSPGFYATIKIWVVKGAAVKYMDSTGHRVDGYMLHLTCEKSSAGPNKRRISVPYLWRFVEDTDEYLMDKLGAEQVEALKASKKLKATLDEMRGSHQECWFDWDWSLGWLIWSMINDDKLYFADERKRMAFLFPCTAAHGSDSSPFFTEASKKGLEDGQELLFGDSEKHSLDEVGKAIMGKPHIVEKLKKMLFITDYQRVQTIPVIPGSDDEDARKSRKEEAEKKKKGKG